MEDIMKKQKMIVAMKADEETLGAKLVDFKNKRLAAKRKLEEVDATFDELLKKRDNLLREMDKWSAAKEEICQQIRDTVASRSELTQDVFKSAKGLAIWCREMDASQVNITDSDDEGSELTFMQNVEKSVAEEVVDVSVNADVVGVNDEKNVVIVKEDVDTDLVNADLVDTDLVVEPETQLEVDSVLAAQLDREYVALRLQSEASVEEHKDSLLMQFDDCFRITGRKKDIIRNTAFNTWLTKTLSLEPTKCNGDVLDAARLLILNSFSSIAYKRRKVETNPAKFGWCLIGVKQVVVVE
jgi:hypothetical protein